VHRNTTPSLGGPQADLRVGNGGDTINIRNFTLVSKKSQVVYRTGIFGPDAQWR
jgi:hypothetical protein